MNRKWNATPTDSKESRKEEAEISYCSLQYSEISFTGNPGKQANIGLIIVFVIVFRLYAIPAWLHTADMYVHSLFQHWRKPVDF